MMCLLFKIKYFEINLSPFGGEFGLIVYPFGINLSPFGGEFGLILPLPNQFFTLRWWAWVNFYLFGINSSPLSVPRLVFTLRKNNLTIRPKLKSLRLSIVVCLLFSLTIKQEMRLFTQPTAWAVRQPNPFVHAVPHFRSLVKHYAARDGGTLCILWKMVKQIIYKCWTSILKILNSILKMLKLTFFHIIFSGAGESQQ